MNHRHRGPLDPLIDVMPNKRLSELASRIGVSRGSILRWQKDPKGMSLGSRLALQLIARQYNLNVPCLWDAGTEAQKAETKKS